MAARVLSYGDVLLREGDLALLDPPNWFNDQLISFFFELLSREEGVAVCGPRPGQWQELDAFLAPLQVAKRQLVLFALNNNTDSTAANGGSH
ncbi:ULP_PROTEASE domain-containing protein, partial [Haematococcus lacustris]